MKGKELGKERGGGKKDGRKERRKTIKKKRKRRERGKERWRKGEWDADRAKMGGGRKAGAGALSGLRVGSGRPPSRDRAGHPDSQGDRSTEWPSLAESPTGGGGHARASWGTLAHVSDALRSPRRGASSP